MSADRIHVLFVNHTACFGGAERGLLDMARSLSPEEFDCTVALPGEGPLREYLHGLGITTESLPFLRFRKTRNPCLLFYYAVNWIWVSFQLAYRARRIRVDVLHANSHVAQLYTGLAARLSGIPCVWHCRDLVDLGSLGKWMSQSATRIVAVSSVVRETLGRQIQSGCGPLDSKLTVIPNGVDREEFCDRGRRTEVRAALGLSRPSVLICMVGHLVPWKKHALFLRAAAEVAEQLDGVHFVIVGGDIFGDQSPYVLWLKTLTGALGLSDRVSFLGVQEDVPKILEGVDLLVHPADKEPFGRCVTEAMALGKPVVAVDAAGPAEIIENGKSGLLVPHDDPGSMARAILRLVHDRDLCEKICGAARRRIAARYDLQETTKEMETLYRAVAKSPSV